MTYSDWEYDYENNERLLRWHQAILELIKEPCHHGKGANYPFPQADCDWCFSTVVVSNCTVLAARFSARKEEAA